MSTEVSHQPMNEDEWDSLVEKADLIEEDGFGPKVFDLNDGRMLKIFRVKRFWSSNLWSPFAKRFVRNTQRLTQLGIPTIQCLQYGSIPHRDRTYVIYERLPGTTLREVPELDGPLLGTFFAHLHDQGVYFRSCHLGNLLLLDDGELGLIDVLDMKFRNGGLTTNERQRNFRRLRSRTQDHKRLDAVWDDLMTAYRKG